MQKFPLEWDAQYNLYAPRNDWACSRAIPETMTTPTKEIEQAWATVQRGDAPAAARIFADIVRRFPDNADAHAGLGHAQLRLGQDGLAAASLQRALDLSNGPAHAWRDLGLIALRRSDLGGAVRNVQRAVEADPGDANAWFLLAQAQFAQSR